MFPQRRVNTHLKFDEDLPCTKAYTNQHGELHLRTRVRVLAGAIQVGDVFTTQTMLWNQGCLILRDGIVCGKSIISPRPSYINEITLLHALQTVREWLRKGEESRKQQITVEAGDPATTYYVQKWMQQDYAALNSAVTSDLMQTISQLDDMNQVDLAISPLNLPEGSEGEQP